MKPLVIELYCGSFGWSRGKRIVRADAGFGAAGLNSARGGKNDGGSWFNVAHNTESGTGNNPVSVPAGQKTQGGSWFRERNGEPQPGIWREDRGVKVPSEDVGNGARFTSRDCGVEARQVCDCGHLVSDHDYDYLNRLDDDCRKCSCNSIRIVEVDGTKIGGDWFSDSNSTCRKHGSRSSARKAASAKIAVIPPDLARHVAEIFLPKDWLAVSPPRNSLQSVEVSR